MRRTAIALLVSAIVGGLALAAPMAVARAAVGAIPTFNADIGGCVSGRATSNANQPIEIAWRAGNGALKAHFTVMTDQFGNWSPPPAICDAVVAWPHDRITAHLSEGITQTRTFVVPDIDGTFDRKTNVVRGHAPKHSSVSVSVYMGGLNDFSFNLFPTCQADRTANDTGIYRYDSTHCVENYDAAGGDYANVQWQGAFDDSVSRTIVAPYLFGNLHRNVVSGFTTPSLLLYIGLRNASGILLADVVTTSTKQGTYSKRFTTGAGHAVTVEPNNQITGNWAGAVSVVVPQMTLSANVASNTVTGTCMPHARYAIGVTYTNGGTFLGSRTDAQGSTGAVSLSPSHTLASGDHISFTCARASGDRFRIEKNVP